MASLVFRQVKTCKDNMNRIKPYIALLISALVLGGCDTVAELTFQEEQIIEAIPQGLIASHCGATSADTTDAIFRFSILTSWDSHLMSGHRYAALNDVLDPGRNFNASDITFYDGWFFVVDDTGNDLSCTSVEECPTGAQCSSATEMGLSQYYYPPNRFCVYPTQIKTASVPRFTHFRTKTMANNPNVFNENSVGRTFAFVIDNSSSLDGSTETGIPNASVATDPWQYRKVGLNQFMDGLALTDENSPRFEFSAHFANGTGATGVYDASEAWMRTEAQWNSNVMSKYPTPSGNSPIWETATASITKLLDSPSSSYSKAMIAMTDGIPNADTDSEREAFFRQLVTTSGMPLHWLELTAGKTHRPYADAVRMGCGTHYLFANPMQFSTIMRNIAINTESHWDVDLDFTATLPDNMTYRLATTFVAKVGESAVTFEAQRMNEDTQTVDYRLIYSTGAAE